MQVAIAHRKTPESGYAVTSFVLAPDCKGYFNLGQKEESRC